MRRWDAEAAEWYAERYGEHGTNRLGLDHLELAADATVLDIGCGTGTALRHAAIRVTEGHLIGVDPVPRMLEIARERMGDVNLDLRLGPASELPVDDASCDLVLAFDTLDHWWDVPAGLAQVQRVLKPGGRFVVLKDASVPSLQGTPAVLAAGGFTVVDSVAVDAEGVAFTLWVSIQVRPTHSGDT